METKLEFHKGKSRRYDFYTNPAFWDCECEENYIHLKGTPCPVCGNENEDSPDSRQDEIIEYLIGKQCFITHFDGYGNKVKAVTIKRKSKRENEMTTTDGWVTIEHAFKNLLLKTHQNG